MGQPDPKDGTGTPQEASTPPLHEALLGVVESSRRQVAELLELFTLELRHSGLMLGRAITQAIIAAIAMFSVWALLLAAVASALLAAGWSLSVALTLLALANVALLLGALWIMRRALSGVGIDSTRKALGLGVGHAAE